MARLVPRSSGRELGFTLLELLLAVFLVAGLALALAGTFSLLAQGRRVQAQYVERTQQLRFAYRLLHSALGSTAARLKEPGSWPYFLGEEQEVRFLSQVPVEIHSLGGIYHWRLRLGRNEAGQLALFAENTKAITWLSEPRRLETRLQLLAGLQTCRFTYGVGEREYRNWNGEQQGGLPHWVKMSFVLSDGQTQTWILPIYVDFKP